MLVFGSNYRYLKGFRIVSILFWYEPYGVVCWVAVFMFIHCWYIAWDKNVWFKPSYIHVFFGCHFSSNRLKCCWCTPLIKQREMEKLLLVHASFTETQEKKSPKWENGNHFPFLSGNYYQLRWLVQKIPKKTRKVSNFDPNIPLTLLFFFLKSQQFHAKDLPKSLNWRKYQILGLPTSEQWKIPWLVGLYRGLYYPGI